MFSQKSNSIYIHIPFCLSKCFYCNFISFPSKKNLIESYLNALKQEIKETFSNKKPLIKTIYFGGGTPSILKSEQISSLIKVLFENINIAENPEITFEINPETVGFNYLHTLKKIGINRLSIGIQTFDDNILKSINRQHTSQKACSCIKLAQKAGFKNISIDLIYGLPYQTLKHWKYDLEQAINLNIQHISAYGLKIEENTKFGKNPPSNLPNEDLTNQMYFEAIDFLFKNDFNHYEISNFAKETFESQHNLVYWNNKEYFAFGVASHGYLNRTRFSHPENIEKYIQNPLDKKEESKISNQEFLEEALFLGLRLCKGLNMDDFNKKYNINILEKYSKIIEKNQKNELLEIKNNHLKLTKKGLIFSNNVFADFINS